MLKNGAKAAAAGRDFARGFWGGWSESLWIPSAEGFCISGFGARRLQVVWLRRVAFRIDGRGPNRQVQKGWFCTYGKQEMPALAEWTARDEVQYSGSFVQLIYDLVVKWRRAGNSTRRLAFGELTSGCS
jgi:hypothetical protein